MLKRIVIGILSFVLAACTLCGCSFFSHDTERDLQQKIAYVKPYTITNSVTVGDGEDSEPQSVDYKTSGKTIYKRDLVEYVSNNASNLSSSFGTNYKGMYEYAVSMLINVELVINEVDALIDCGKVEWGMTQSNAIKKNIYTVIDNTLFSIKNTILDERDQEQIVNDSDDADSSTTYPVKPEATDDDADDAVDTEPWEPSRSRYPGLHGDQDERSLEREAMRRFIALIKSRVADDFRITSAERAKFDKEIKAIDEVINTQGIEYVYPLIGTYPLSDDSDFGYIMYYVSGESIERSQKITSMQEYLNDSVTVSEEDVTKKYTSLLREQIKLYTADISAYDTAMNDSSTTVLYHPNNNYFYVKHILLPFSDEQKAALTAYKASSEITSLHENEQKKYIEKYRDRLVQSIVCYPHKDGEDDLTRPMSVDEVMAHVRSVMLAKESNVAEADTAFDDLIYLYNTDPGAFDNNQGYIVKYKLNDGESETYMQEFADAARIMRDTLAPGQVYYEKVVTDYGVHIMYLASVTKPGEVSLYDYTTPGKLQTYYELVEAPILTALGNAAYDTWERNVLSYNYNKYSVRYTENYSDLWED